VSLASRVDFREHRYRLGSDDAARMDFHRMLTALIQVQYPSATEVRANPGDWGIDTSPTRWRGRRATSRCPCW